MPSHLSVKPQLHEPHISVIRWETPSNLELWGAYEGEIVSFEYSSHVFNDDTYYWLDVRCKRFKQIRVELGLRKYRRGKNCFHATIGNTKPNVQRKKYAEI